jgi:hypothetical protein
MPFITLPTSPSQPKEKTHGNMFSNIIFTSTKEVQPQVWDKEKDELHIGLDFSTLPKYDTDNLLKQLDNLTNSIFLELKDTKTWVIVGGKIDDRIIDRITTETMYALLFKLLFNRNSYRHNRVMLVFNKHYKNWWDKQRPENTVYAACSFVEPRKYEWYSAYLGNGYTASQDAYEILFYACVPIDDIK